jgi:hypothetical protein
MLWWSVKYISIIKPVPTWLRTARNFLQKCEAGPQLVMVKVHNKFIYRKVIENPTELSSSDYLLFCCIGTLFYSFHMTDFTSLVAQQLPSHLHNHLSQISGYLYRCMLFYDRFDPHYNFVYFAFTIKLYRLQYVYLYP